ncbi:GNAT family N-acetyltransferase [Undibacterium rugosum]|uniref:GNAT family N-acetyltransferase n=1 Tax=Undibacterium rugosum TaxID=2762291 RepID=A0A923IA60_9BURK|nr:GNAT family N-acetyltransferase [Undibacterium rugosum]MBC3936373.1 GNAT family N-acetyltransferase [Undibacterium rugosum]MBR7779939.1 GNAT family N-acetyltransferase [Undibacterium rugosum]
MECSDDLRRMDITMIHRFLSEESSWAKGIPLDTVQRGMEHSLCFGGWSEGQQIAFARVITDHASFAYLLDVFVLPEYRGQGYSKQLLEFVFRHPALQGLRRFVLVSSNARGLYQQFGFQTLGKPETYMEILRPALYQR